MSRRKTDKERRKRRSFFSYLLEFIIYVTLAVFCVYIVPKYIIQRTEVDGNSMEDTLHHKDSLLIDKISYRFHSPERYDIIVFYPEGRNVEKFYVKRIYGLPGETIQIKENDIYINDKKIDDPYAKDAMTDYGIAAEPYTLGSDEYFVLGDHRSVSKDSRYTSDSPEKGPGPVKFENISGKAILRIWPLSAFGSI